MRLRPVPRHLRRAAALSALALALLPCPASAWENVSQGAIADVTPGAGGAGDFLLGELGVQSVGMMSLSQARWLLQWDGLFAAKGGVLADQLPYTPLLGGHLRAFAEAGRRLDNVHRGSLYLGLRLSEDAQILLPPGRGLEGLSQFNNLDGVGDASLIGAVRVAAGWSHLGPHHLLLLTAYVEEMGTAPQTNQPGEAFTNLGIATRFDLPRLLTVSVEGSWGRTPTSAPTSLDSTGYDSLITASVIARRVFRNGMWLGFTWTLSLLEESTRYAHGPTYSTTDAPTTSVTLTYGFPLGRQEAP